MKLWHVLLIASLQFSLIAMEGLPSLIDNAGVIISPSGNLDGNLDRNNGNEFTLGVENITKD